MLKHALNENRLIVVSINAQNYENTNKRIICRLDSTFD